MTQGRRNVARAVVRQDRSGMRGLMLQRSNRPWGAIDCRQPRYPRKIPEDRRFCAPALRQVCLCQRSAERPRSNLQVGPTPYVRPAQFPPSRSHRRPVRRQRSIVDHAGRASENVSHFEDTILRPQLGPAGNSSPISDVQTKSRPRISDLCRMHRVRQPQVPACVLNVGRLQVVSIG